MSVCGEVGVGAMPATTSTSQDAVMLQVYWPTLNSHFHTGLRCMFSDRSTEPA